MTRYYYPQPFTRIICGVYFFFLQLEDRNASRQNCWKQQVRAYVGSRKKFHYRGKYANRFVILFSFLSTQLLLQLEVITLAVGYVRNLIKDAAAIFRARPERARYTFYPGVSKNHDGDVKKNITPLSFDAASPACDWNSYLSGIFHFSSFSITRKRRKYFSIKRIYMDQFHPERCCVVLKNFHVSSLDHWNESVLRIFDCLEPLNKWYWQN